MPPIGKVRDEIESVVHDAFPDARVEIEETADGLIITVRGVIEDARMQQARMRYPMLMKWEFEELVGRKAEQLRKEMTDETVGQLAKSRGLSLERYARMLAVDALAEGETV